MEFTTKDLVDYVAIASGITSIGIGVMYSILTVKIEKLQAVLQYFESGDSEDEINRRKHIFESDPLNINEDKAVLVSSFFHRWGLLAKKGLLPMWVFDSSSGVSIVRLYDKLDQHIEKKRKSENPLYAEHFSWLAEKIRVRKSYSNAVKLLETKPNK